MKSEKQKISKTHATENEVAAYREMVELHANSPIPSTEILAHLSVYQPRSAVAHNIFMDDLYRRIMDVPGIIVEFGVRWGRNMALLSELRNIYEPFHQWRRIVGFDTFEGFPSVSPKDGRDEVISENAYSVSAGYEAHLDRVLAAHEQLGPRGHIRTCELVKGDVVETLPRFLEENPEAIIALAYFDMDIYEPTKACLELIKPHLVKGSVVGFDELVNRVFPGETVALSEAWGLNGLRLRRLPQAPYESFLVVE
jgi:hypothetical protein